MTHHLLDFSSKLRIGGFRVTPQRKAILDAICEGGPRATVEEIFVRLQKKSPTLNRATIYRNLHFLQRMNLVHSAGSGKDRRFEIAGLEPHHHLLCRKCGMEEGLEQKYVDHLKAAIRQSRRFTINDDHLTFYGVCRRCSSGRSRKSKGDTKDSK